MGSLPLLGHSRHLPVKNSWGHAPQQQEFLKGSEGKRSWTRVNKKSWKVIKVPLLKIWLSVWLVMLWRWPTAKTVIAVITTTGLTSKSTLTKMIQIPHPQDLAFKFLPTKVVFCRSQASLTLQGSAGYLHFTKHSRQTSPIHEIRDWGCCNKHYELQKSPFTKLSFC